MTLLDKLLAELRAKFNRYGVIGGGGDRLLNRVGFRYLLRSCLSLEDLQDAQVAKYFALGAGLEAGDAKLDQTLVSAAINMVVGVEHLSFFSSFGPTHVHHVVAFSPRSLPTAASSTSLHSSL